MSVWLLNWLLQTELVDMSEVCENLLLGNMSYTPRVFSIYSAMAPNQYVDVVQWVVSLRSCMV